MKDKHIRIAEDSNFQQLVYREIENCLQIDTVKTSRLLILKFIFYFLFLSVAYLLIYKINNPLLFIVNFIIYGLVVVLFAFNFAHDFSHNTVFKSRKWNNLCFIFIYTLVGAHAEAWKYRHIHSHHYAPNVEDYDSDLKISGLIRVIPGSKYRWYHKFQHWYAPALYTTYSLFWVFIKDIALLFSKKEGPRPKTFLYHCSFWLQKIFYFTYILALPLVYSGQKPIIVFLAFFIMHCCQSLFLLFTFFMTHHVEKTNYPLTDKNGYINCSWFINQVKSSNDFYPFSRFANFIFGGFNNHVAHHLFPHIHHVHYPELNKILYPLLLRNNITPNVTTWFGGVISHLKLLRLMSKAR
ncbi:MAG: fatty acid desaturase [Chitinophagaceae bacterium]|nr:fatty acid desaturase [Chitinophagaceae bacterium]